MTPTEFYALPRVYESYDISPLLSGEFGWFEELNYVCPQLENADRIRSQTRLIFKVVKEKEFFAGEMRNGFIGPRKTWTIGYVCFDDEPFMIVRNPVPSYPNVDFYTYRIITSKDLYKSSLLFIQSLLVHVNSIPTNREYTRRNIEMAFDSIPQDVYFLDLSGLTTLSPQEISNALEYSLNLPN